MEFEAIDTEVHPEAMEDLKPFGIPRVPAVIVGDRAVHGWNPKGVAELVGVAYDESGKLSCDELAKRLDTILVASQRVVRQIPPEHLDLKYPGRDRTIHQLGFHIFRIAQTYIDAREGGMLQEDWFGENPPPEMADAESVAQYGQGVRERLAAYLQQDGVYDGVVETYYGAQTAPEFFERTVWHTAQHLRHVYALLEGVGIAPDEPLTEADYAGLPLPENLW